jgi:two-component system response regulator HydG
VRARQGLFGEADGGTLLLDEVAELSPALQAKLLRVLQEGEVKPLGEDRPRRVDVRIVAATHRDLKDRVARGEFREDLYFRLNVVHLHITPLRERPRTWGHRRALTGRFAERFGAGPMQPPAAVRRLAATPDGQVRELEERHESMGPLGGRQLECRAGAASAGRRAGRRR